MAIVFLSYLVTPTAAHGNIIKPIPRTVTQEITQWGICGQPFDELDTPPTNSFPVLNEFNAGEEFDVTVHAFANHGGSAWFEFICTDGKDNLNAEALKNSHSMEWETLKRAPSDRNRYGASSFSYIPGYETELYWPGKRVPKDVEQSLKTQPENFDEFSKLHVKAKYIAPRKACSHGILRYIWDAAEEDNLPFCIPCGPGKRNGIEEPSKKQYAQKIADKTYENLPYCCDLDKYSKKLDVEKPWQRTSGISPQTFVNCADVKIRASAEPTTQTSSPSAPASSCTSSTPSTLKMERHPTACMKEAKENEIHFGYDKTSGHINLCIVSPAENTWVGLGAAHDATKSGGALMDGSKVAIFKGTARSEVYALKNSFPGDKGIQDSGISDPMTKVDSKRTLCFKLEKTKLNKEGGLQKAPFIWATGTSEQFSYHQARGLIHLNLESSMLASTGMPTATGATTAASTAMPSTTGATTAEPTYEDLGSNICADSDEKVAYQQREISSPDLCKKYCNGKSDCTGFSHNGTFCRIYKLPNLQLSKWGTWDNSHCWVKRDSTSSKYIDTSTSSKYIDTDSQFIDLGMSMCAGSNEEVVYDQHEISSVDSCKEYCNKKSDCTGFSHNGPSCRIYTYPNVQLSALATWDDSHCWVKRGTELGRSATQEDEGLSIAYIVLIIGAVSLVTIGVATSLYKWNRGAATLSTTEAKKGKKNFKKPQE